MADSTPTPPNAVDPGYTTTEFWQTLLFHLIAATVALGSLFGVHFNLNGLQSIVPAVAIVAAAFVQAAYSRSRATVKAAASAAAVLSESNPSTHVSNGSSAQVDGERADRTISVAHNEQSTTSTEIVPHLVERPPPDSAEAMMNQSKVLADIRVLLRRIYQEVMAIQEPPA
jgi:hypothetical protein